MLRGSLTALVTPFLADGGFDEKAFRAFVDWQIDEGTTGLVPVGTTGESPTLSHDEHHLVVKTCIDQMMLITTLNRMTGETRGTVTFRVFCHALAPSKSAAS